MNITYVSACMDSSGYAEAARNHIAALHYAGVGIKVIPISFEKWRTDLGRIGILVQNLINSTVEGNIRILHLTPQNYPSLIDPKKYNIGYVAWETDRLPTEWVGYINLLNEIWVPCDYNIEVFKNSGVKIPIFSMPHPFDTTGQPEPTTSVIVNRRDQDFVFYSIFQWTERKNPVGLLKAYLTEFEAEENVVLVLKTYLVNPNAIEEAEEIKKAIADIKRKLYRKSYPKVLLISSLLSRGQIQSLHHSGDCYVSLNRCEGFGIPLVEAMMAEKPVIATSYGGPNMFLKGPEQDIQTGYPVDYMLTPCYGMPWDMYNGKMNWADPDLLHAKKLMREVFTNRDQAKQVGKTGKKFIEDNYSWTAMGKKMADRLIQIEKGLK